MHFRFLLLSWVSTKVGKLKRCSELSYPRQSLTSGFGQMSKAGVPRVVKVIVGHLPAMNYILHHSDPVCPTDSLRLT